MFKNELINKLNVETNEKEIKNLKLSESEISSVNGFDTLSSYEKEELLDFVYKVSLVLLKSHSNEQS